jgi:hypothetical protein
MQSSVTIPRRNQPRKPLEKFTAIPGENWKKIEGCGGLYYCSNLGRFRKVYQDDTGAIHDFILKTRPRHGAINVCLTIAQGDTRGIQAGKVILFTFRPDEDHIGKHVFYRDGDYRNLKLDNLFWATQKEIRDIRNNLGITRRPLIPKPYQTPQGVVKTRLVLFSENEKAEMKKLYSEGFTQDQIAEQFGATQTYVSRILRNLA